MSILQEVESLHCQSQRNVLKILSQDTRHTKVVNLACGTHRVSDELKKHYLTDIEGTQYTTNLDRNRYGSDDQYMFTGNPPPAQTVSYGLGSYQTQLNDVGIMSVSCRRRGVGSEKERDINGICWNRSVHLQRTLA